MNKNILYIVYTDMTQSNSGSEVRPKKMYEAFLNLNYNVKLLKGSQSKQKEKRKARIENIKQIEYWLEKNKPDYCYIESPSDPIILREDRNLIKKIHKMNIKIGYFYRDAHYKLGQEAIFNDEKTKKLSKKYIRYLYYKFLFWRDEKFLAKYVDIVYFPSKSMTKYFKFRDMRTLPPAGERIEFNENSKADSLIYVGGITKNYGIQYLLDAMNKINETQYIKLILVCRKEELENIDKKYIDKKWLEIYNVSGIENLKPLYERARIALLPKKPSLYNDFAISVKTFEYMSFHLPIVAMDTVETSQILKELNIGLISKDNSEDFANTILKLYNDLELYGLLKKNVKLALNKNLWTTRVEQIDNDLSNS